MAFDISRWNECAAVSRCLLEMVHRTQQRRVEPAPFVAGHLKQYPHWAEAPGRADMLVTGELIRELELAQTARTIREGSTTWSTACSRPALTRNSSRSGIPSRTARRARARGHGRAGRSWRCTGSCCRDRWRACAPRCARAHNLQDRVISPPAAARPSPMDNTTRAG